MSRSNGLRALEVAQRIVDRVLAAVEHFPTRDPAGLRRQLSESANSVAANIAEGFGRGTVGERLYHLRVARGSLEETQSPLKVSRNREYVSTTDFFEILNLTLVPSRTLRKLH